MTYDFGQGANLVSRADPGDQVVAPWLTESFSFVATSATTTLSFTGESLVAGFYGIMIDNVQLELFELPAPAPEPSGLALLTAGGMVFTFARRRKRQPR